MKKVLGVMLLVTSAVFLRIALPQGKDGGRARSAESQWTVEGDVVNDAGPLSEVAIQISGPSRVDEVTTDLGGHYMVHGSVAGTYAVKPYREATGGALPRSVRVAAGSHVESVNFHLDSEAVISGRVLDQDKAPIQGAHVLAQMKTFRDGRVSFLPRQDAATDDSGEYRLTDLRAGSYYLVSMPKPLHISVRALAGRAKEKRRPQLGLSRTTFYPGAPTYDGVSPMRVRPGEHLEGMDFILRETETYCMEAGVAGQRQGPRGNDGAGLRFSVFELTGDTALSIASELVGSGDQLELCGLSPGQYRAVAIGFSRETGKVTGFGEREFSIDSRDLDIGELSPLPTVRVHGAVLVDDARPEDVCPPNLMVRLEVRARPGFGGENLKGPVNGCEFMIDGVLSDEYGMRLLGLARGYYIREAAQQGRDVVKNGARADRGEIRIALGKNGPAVSGQVVGDDGQPARDALVFLVPKSGDGIQKRQSDQDGHFEFTSEIGPGEYRLLALAGLYDGEDEDSSVVLGHLSHGIETHLDPNAKVSIVLKVRNAH
jgi:hypothetical protein